MDEPWDPWAAAESLGVQVRTDAVADLLGGAFAARWRGVAIVALSPKLDAPGRRAALAHELVHLERGGGIDEPGMPGPWAAVVAREEAAVDDEVARRLVPAAALRAAQAAGEADPGALARDLGVPEWVVRRAVALAASRAPDQRPRRSRRR